MVCHGPPARSGDAILIYSYFTGHDVYNSWQGMYALFSSISAHAFLNHIMVYVMPGEGIEVGLPLTVENALKRRPAKVVETARTREEPLRGFGTTLPEARTLVTYLALSGVSYAVASILPELPEERIRLLKMTLPPCPSCRATFSAAARTCSGTSSNTRLPTLISTTIPRSSTSR